MFGGAGNDTLSANGGSASAWPAWKATTPTTSPAARPTRRVTLNDLATFGQNHAPDRQPDAGINTILFPGVTTGITLDLSNTSPGAELADRPGQAQHGRARHHAVADRAVPERRRHAGQRLDPGDAVDQRARRRHGGNDTLVGGSGPATLVAGSGNDPWWPARAAPPSASPTAAASAATPSTRRPATALNTLDFSQFGGPVDAQPRLRPRRRRSAARPA